MEDTYTLKENHIILNPNTKYEEDITEDARECEYCQEDKKTCRGNKIGIFCDWFKVLSYIEEV